MEPRKYFLDFMMLEHIYFFAITKVNNLFRKLPKDSIEFELNLAWPQEATFTKLLWRHNRQC